MDSEKRAFDVQIGGVTLKLRSSHDEKTVKKLTDCVNNKVSEALEQGISLQKAVVLAALHLAEENFIFKKQAFEQLDEIESQATGLLNRLESSPMMAILDS